MGSLPAESVTARFWRSARRRVQLVPAGSYKSAIGVSAAARVPYIPIRMQRYSLRLQHCLYPRRARLVSMNRCAPFGSHQAGKRAQNGLYSHIESRTQVQ